MGPVSGSTRPSSEGPRPPAVPGTAAGAPGGPTGAAPAPGDAAPSRVVVMPDQAAEAGPQKLSATGPAPGPDPAPLPAAPEDPLERLFAALCGDVLLRYASGQRVLDLGYGCPEVTAWMRRRSGQHLSIVAREVLESEAASVSLSEYADDSFDLVYCLSVFPHLGRSAEQSELLAAAAMREATRLLAPGGILAVEVANPRSLHGLQEGIRQPMTVVSSKKLVSATGGLVTRWETPGRLRDLAPERLTVHSVHGLGVFVPYRRMLSVPGMATFLRRLEWWARDRPLLQHFGRRLLVLLRKQVLAPEPT